MNKIYIYFEDIPPIKLNENLLNKNIKRLINNELKMMGEISVIFCSDDFLLKLNEQYLNHDYYTDIITFDYVNGSVISGDLFISIDRVRENAYNFKKEIMNEIYRVVFHGILHLTGYKDKTNEEQKLMREKEEYYLEGVDFSEEYK